MNLLSSIVRRLFTRPVWHLQRHRHFPVKRAFHQLAPVASREGANVAAVLTTPDMLQEGYWALWSWSRFLSEDFTPCLFVDGPVPSTAQCELHTIIPTARIRETNQAIAPELLNHPGFLRLYQHYPCGKKLALLLTLQKTGDVLYGDSDVLVFRNPRDIFHQRSLGKPLFMQEEMQAPEDPWVAAEAARRGLRLFPTLNSGLLYIPQGSLDVDLACEVVSDWHPPCRSWVIEQTMVNLLFTHAGAVGLPADTYVINTRRQFFFESDVDYRRVVARHFVTPVRHLMYIKGYRLLLAQSRETARKECEHAA